MFPRRRSIQVQMVNPEVTGWWQCALEETVHPAQDIGCTIINVLVESRIKIFTLALQLQTAGQNLEKAVE